MHRRITGRLVIATHNPGKLAEMRELLAPHGVEAISAGDLGLFLVLLDDQVARLLVDHVLQVRDLVPHRDQEPLGMTADALARHVAFFLPLGAVVPEELAFRGTLLGALLRRGGVRAAVAGSAAAFALWHGSVVLVTVADTTLGPPSPLFLPAALAAVLILVAGGAIMAVLRIATGSLASTMAAHWVFNAVILVGLWRASPPLVPPA